MYNYPMIAWVFGIPFGMNFIEIHGSDAISNLTSDFQGSLISMVGLTIFPGALIGILGGIVASNNICLPLKMTLDGDSDKNMGANRGMPFINDE
jgi:hypothetical protein